jgi:hypothetical protein
LSSKLFNLFQLDSYFCHAPLGVTVAGNVGERSPPSKALIENKKITKSAVATLVALPLNSYT